MRGWTWVAGSVLCFLQSERVPVARRGARAVMDEHAGTALHIACARGNVAMVEAIVEQMSSPR